MLRNLADCSDCRSAARQIDRDSNRQGPSISSLFLAAAGLYRCSFAAPGAELSIDWLADWPCYMPEVPACSSFT